MIRVENLNFSYNKTPFIEDISFTVEKGEIFGFLGPSGAGKTTLQKILTGQITNYSGIAEVFNTVCSKHDSSFYENIGIDFEFPTLYEKMTAIQNLKFFSSLYKNHTRTPMELLQMVGLENDADKKVADFSKGMKSRLNFVRALVNDPKVLFLDEPTSGLDPTNSRIMKDLILAEKSKGTTMIITTHNMEDATELCDRVAFIVNGKMPALDTPHNLIMASGTGKVKYTYMDKDNEITGECSLSEIADIKQIHNLTSIHSMEPTLNDIFIEITGRTLI